LEGADLNDFDELDAMKKIAAALEPLDDEARGRALQWALSRYRSSKSVVAFEQPSMRQSDSSQNASSGYATFAELFDAASPTTEKEKALVAAYWMQICENAASFQAQSLNDLLKDLGHRIGNITEALTGLKNERPAYVLQIKKGGSSRQARKIYKLTQEGAKRIAVMTSGALPSSDTI
jgi:hypothetical protein